MKERASNIVRYIVVYVVLIVLFFLAIHLSVNTGTIKIPFIKVLKILFTKEFVGTSEYIIITKIRLPRLLLAGVLGGALALSGYLLQTFFRNPIAGPFVLGISSGAKLFVGFAIVVLSKAYPSLPMSVQVIAAFVGSLCSMGIVLIFSKKMKSMAMLLVVGVMIGYICTASTDFLITFASDHEIANLTHWGLGSFSTANWEKVKFSSIVILPLLVVTFCLSKPIGAYQLGEGYAQSMGLNVNLFRKIIILISSLLSACVTAVAGPISFVGIAVPHIAKKLLNTAKPLVAVPAIFLCGSVFCMFCDLIARTAFSPVELSIGTVTSLFGAPIVIILLIKRNKRAE